MLGCEVELDAATAGLTSYLASLRYSPVALDVARAFQVTRIKVECCRDERFVKAHSELEALLR